MGMKRRQRCHGIGSSSAIKWYKGLAVVKWVDVSLQGQRERASCPYLAGKEQIRVKTHSQPFRGKGIYIFLPCHSDGVIGGMTVHCNCRVDEDRSQPAVPCSTSMLYLRAYTFSQVLTTHAKQAVPVRTSTTKSEHGIRVPHL